MIDYDTLMKFGSVIRQIEFDFSRSSINEAIFSIKVSQRDEAASEIRETKIEFEAEFEGNMFLSLRE